MISGFKDISLIDYPGHIAPVVFIGGCNFRCPFCHNRSLVLSPSALNEELTLERIKKSRTLANGVVVTGGEPTLWNGLKPFIKKIKQIGLKIKLDTNGYLTGVLGDLLDSGLVDYVAMDIKTSPARYHQATGVHVDKEIIRSSIELLRCSTIKHEFRTTCVPGLVGKNDIEIIAKMIGPDQVLSLQPFIPVNTIDPRFTLLKPYASGTMQEFLSVALNAGVKARVV